MQAIGLLGVARRFWGWFKVKIGISPKVVREVNYISVRKRNREIRIGLGHEVYTGDMVNHFDYYHSAIVPLAVNNRLVVDYSRPGVHKLRRSGVEFEYPSLPEPDESTDVYMETLALKPGEVVFDLGAYAQGSALLSD